MEALESRQLHLLRRIHALERLLHPSASTNRSTSKIHSQSEQQSHYLPVEKRLAYILKNGGIEKFEFKRVPADYYDRPIEERRTLLGAPSIHHLFKSIVMVNTQAHESVRDCSNRCNSKYYVIVIQYTARLNAEKVRQFVYSLNNGKVPKKRFNMRLAPEPEANKLTGYGHNAVTPIGMLTDIPVIVSDAILNLEPKSFWMGGGEVDLKLQMITSDFVAFVKPFVVDCTYTENEAVLS